MKISELQERQPWVIPYSPEFIDSQRREGHRYLTHDLLHVYKSLGKIAALAERIDHGREPNMTVDELAGEVADLVICALHIASNNPLGAFSLQGAVLTAIDRRNGSNLAAESLAGAVQRQGTEHG
jgi:hypothetical protein